ncbi:UNVERIFIED_CONTAM: hypothetical protein Sangu_2848800 [Sesamum angustifolium]|uniref:Uncharacterized protein n=1 Tax=Sesamum angustifolium TaxID=2727405 RepID=A0AAW2IR01_9LAMI
MEMAILGGVVGKMSRQFYALFCLGVLLISVAIAQRYSSVSADDQELLPGDRRRDPANRRLRSLRGSPLHRRPLQSH